MEHQDMALLISLCGVAIALVMGLLSRRDAARKDLAEATEHSTGDHNLIVQIGSSLDELKRDVRGIRDKQQVMAEQLAATAPELRSLQSAVKDHTQQIEGLRRDHR